MYRQGDVLIEPVTEIKGDKREKGKHLLIQGEGADHGHFISGAEVFDAPPNKENTTHFLTVEDEATIEHLLISSGVWTKEHASFTIPVGTYKVTRQVELSPYEKIIQQVRD